jgi:hypothetical protein
MRGLKWTQTVLPFVVIMLSAFVFLLLWEKHHPDKAEFKPPIGNICISYVDIYGQETQPTCYPEIKVYGATGYRIWVTK